MRGIARLNERLKDIQIRVGVVEQQNRALLKTFPTVISSLMRAQFMSSD
jgi:hypothetical protein